MEYPLRLCLQWFFKAKTVKRNASFFSQQPLVFFFLHSFAFLKTGYKSCLNSANSSTIVFSGNVCTIVTGCFIVYALYLCNSSGASTPSSRIHYHCCPWSWRRVKDNVDRWASVVFVTMFRIDLHDSGMMSLQEAAIQVLRFHESYFPSYNVFLDKVCLIKF